MSGPSKAKHNMPVRRLGKAAAREQFAPLIEALAITGGIVEITDYGKVAAVMLNHKDYLGLLAQSNQPARAKHTLAGSAVLVADLAEASDSITKSILLSVTGSLKHTAKRPVTRSAKKSALNR